LIIINLPISKSKFYLWWKFFYYILLIPVNIMLEDKVALITGASRGIGRGIAACFAQYGAYVGINYKEKEQAAKNTLTLVHEYGGEGLLLRGDVSKRGDVKKLINQLVDEKGHIDILVNNAGVYFRNSFADLPVDKWENVMAVNLTGSFHLSQEVLQYMPQGGRIIFISSQLAFRGSPHGSDYSTTKAGMLGLMRSLALELAEKQILVNAVAPGTIDTDIIAHYSSDQRTDRIKEIPLRRLGTANDVANTCLFLASDLSSYITGETINVNGGLYIH
jgi:3-oxoacyl-[acyl-carrier protein] reductase